MGGGGRDVSCRITEYSSYSLFKKKSTQFKASQFSNKFTLRPIMTTFFFLQTERWDEQREAGAFPAKI